MDISAKSVLRKLFICISLLLLAQIVCLIGYYMGRDYMMGFIPLFYFDSDSSIPAYFSAIIIFISSALLYLIYTTQNKQKYYWLGLSIIFLFLSLDESISIHERLMEPVRSSLNISGYLLYAWVIPYGILVLIFITFYAKFLFSLPKPIMQFFILSGALYVGGALGMELIGGKVYDSEGNTFYYKLITTIEELMEMTGIATFIYSNILFLATNKDNSKLSFLISK